MNLSLMTQLPYPLSSRDLINDLMTILNADNMSAEELRQAQLKFIGNLTRMFQE